MEKILSDLDCRSIPLQINTIAVLFTDDSEIHSLNKEFRDKDKATDVLSFSHIEGLKPKPWDCSLGELVISLDTAIVQAKRYKVTVSNELIRLLVHGTLHLLGYDHENVSKNTAQKMRRLETKIRRNIALKALV